jgi:hypothetical protein
MHKCTLLLAADTLSTTSNYTPTPPLLMPGLGELPFGDSFILNQRQTETIRNEALSVVTYVGNDDFI